MKPTREEIEQAIAKIEECRDIHIHWADYLDAGNTWEPSMADVGDSDHHKEWTANYEQVLDVLRRTIPSSPTTTISVKPTEIRLDSYEAWGNRSIYHWVRNNTATACGLFVRRFHWKRVLSMSADELNATEGARECKRCARILGEETTA